MALLIQQIAEKGRDAKPRADGLLVRGDPYSDRDGGHDIANRRSTMGRQQVARVQVYLRPVLLYRIAES